MGHQNDGILVVLGAWNYDIIFKTDRMPEPGETIAARSKQVTFGGKGANAAVSAFVTSDHVNRDGAKVYMVGTLGKDGEEYIKHIEKDVVEKFAAASTVFPMIQLDSDLPTGSAFIVVDQPGENFIVYHAGANAEKHSGLDLPKKVLDRVHESNRGWTNVTALLLQNEIDEDFNVRAITQFKRPSSPNSPGMAVFLNPSPVDDFVRTGSKLLEATKHHVDVVILNQHEYEIVRSSVKGQDHDWQADFAPIVIVTQGDAPAFMSVRQIVTFEDTRRTVTAIRCVKHILQVQARDICSTVGAGDAFAGCFTALCNQIMHAQAEFCLVRGQHMDIETFTNTISAVRQCVYLAQGYATRVVSSREPDLHTRYIEASKGYSYPGITSNSLLEDDRDEVHGRQGPSECGDNSCKHCTTLDESGARFKLSK
eukprot:Clim_evm15s161 gene=Clim_evmTU15s161